MSKIKPAPLKDKTYTKLSVTTDDWCHARDVAAAVAWLKQHYVKAIKHNNEVIRISNITNGDEFTERLNECCKEMLERIDAAFPDVTLLEKGLGEKTNEKEEKE